MAADESKAQSFGAVAAAYESGRPEYPLEAVEWMLQPAAREDRPIRVADVGAGTGKLTRAAVELGAEVVAVDPDPKMLAMLRESVRGVPTFLGKAESLPLPSSSVDVVLLGQAWHWVDPAAGSAEVARVLRPRGVLGLIWNIRDETVPEVARMTQIMHGSNAEVLLADGDPPVAEPFRGLESRTWRWKRRMTRPVLLDMARSRSYVITATPEERDRIERELGELFDDMGAIGQASIDLPYVTKAYRAVLPADLGREASLPAR